MKRLTLPGGYSPTFYLAFLSCLLFFSSAHLLITPLPLYIQSLGGGATQVGLAQMTFAVSSLVLRPYVGRLVDTRGRKLVLLIGTAIFTLGPLCYTQTTTIPALHLARMFHGIGIAAFTTAYATLVADVTPPSRWGAALGLSGIAPPLAIVLASPAGTSLLAHTSFRVVFLVSSLTALASLLVALVIREPSHQIPASPASASTAVGLADVLKLRGVVVPSLATLTLGLSYGTVYAFLPLFALDRNLGNVGLFFTTLSLFFVASRSSVGRLSDRVGRLPVILPLFAVLGLSLAGLNWTYTFPMLLAMAALQGIGLGGTRVGLETTVVGAAPAKLRGRAVSLIYFCYDLGIGTGSLAMGAVADIMGFGHGYLIVGVVCLLTLVLLGVAMRKPERA
jgi:MFS family permease